MKTVFAMVLLALLAGCGAPIQTRTTGIEESTMLIVRGETLVGLTVSIEPGMTRVIQESDLTPYTMGTLGTVNKEEEGLQTVSFKVDSGELKVTVSRGGAVVLTKRMQFVNGQTREIRIR
jgi:hypothetical protein